MEHREEKTEEVNLPETDEVTFMQPDEPVYDIKEKEDTNDIDILEEELYMEESMQPDEPGLQPHPERKRQGRYRKQLEEAEKTEEAKIPAYSSLVLAVVVLTLGFTAYQNHKKMNEMENTLAQMNQVHIVTEMPETEKTADSGIVVENIAGNIEKQTETKQADEHSTQTEAEQLQTNGTQAAEASAPDETAGIQAGTELSGMTDTEETAETSGTADAQKTMESQETESMQNWEGEQKAEADTDETAGIQAGTELSGMTDTEETAETSGTADAQKTMESQETESMQNWEGEQKAEADTDETNSNKENVKETAAQPDEAQTYLKQGYYVVRQGDNLAAICRKIYQTTAMMDKVCEANGIDDPDAIYAGQYLTLPN
jgi:phage tail protein X